MKNLKKTPKPWTHLEKYALIRSAKEHLFELAEMMDRPFEEVQAKYEELIDTQLKIWDEEIEDLLDKGLTKEEAMKRALAQPIPSLDYKASKDDLSNLDSMVRKAQEVIRKAQEDVIRKLQSLSFEILDLIGYVWAGELVKVIEDNRIQLDDGRCLSVAPYVDIEEAKKLKGKIVTIKVERGVIHKIE